MGIFDFLKFRKKEVNSAKIKITKLERIFIENLDEKLNELLQLRALGEARINDVIKFKNGIWRWISKQKKYSKTKKIRDRVILISNELKKSVDNVDWRIVLNEKKNLSNLLKS